MGIGFSLIFSPSEFKELKALLQENDYPVTKRGLKNFILDSDLEEEELSTTERLGNSLREGILNHPDLTEKITKAGLDALKGAIKRKLK